MGVTPGVVTSKFGQGLSQKSSPSLVDDIDDDTSDEGPRRDKTTTAPSDRSDQPRTPSDYDAERDTSADDADDDSPSDAPGGDG